MECCKAHVENMGCAYQGMSEDIEIDICTLLVWKTRLMRTMYSTEEKRKKVQLVRMTYIVNL